MTFLLKILFLMMLAIAGCQHTPTEESQEKAPLPSNRCPDIAGTYFDRAVDPHDDSTNVPSSGSVADDITSRPHLIGGPGVHNEIQIDARKSCQLQSFDYNRWMSSRCSLRHWFNSSLRDFMLSDKKKKTPSCPSINKIEFESVDNYESLKVITYRDSIVESTYTIDMKTSGFNCEDGIISFKEHDRPIRIYLSDGGSLNVQDGVRGLGLIPGFIIGIPTFYPIPVPYGTSEDFYRWVRVDKAINPYKNCHQRFDDTFKYIKSDEYLIKELTRITDAYNSNRMSEQSYVRLYNYLIRDYGEDKVQKAISELGE